MSALPSPIAPSSIASRTTRRIVSSSAGVARSLGHALGVGAHRAGADERADVHRHLVLLHLAEPRVESARAAPARSCRRSCDVSIACAVADAITPSFTGANVSPSPRIIVVTPCVTMLTTRLSPVSSCTYDCAWMSMTPGATTSPRASIRRFAVRRRERAGGRDAHDAVADDADVAVEPRVARAVDDPAVRDHDVERRRRTGAGARA